MPKSGFYLARFVDDERRVLVYLDDRDGGSVFRVETKGAPYWQDASVIADFGEEIGDAFAELERLRDAIQSANDEIDTLT